MVADIPSEWNSFSYTSIGADLLTHNLHLLCPHALTHAPATPPPTPETCKDVTVLPGPLFFPFANGTDLTKIFSSGGYGPKFMSSFRGYALHLYNHLTKKASVSLLRESVVREVAVRHCPAVVKVLVQRRMYL